MTYKAVGRSIINYAAPVWSPNLHDTNYRKIKYTQNEALRIATGCHKMSSIDHLHTEAEMLKVREHSELLSAQCLARCLEPGNVCHPITTRTIPERQMKETLYTRHRNTVEPMMIKMIGKLHSKHSTLQQSLKLFSVTRGMWYIAPIAQLVTALDLVTSSEQVEGSILTAGKRLSLRNLNVIIRAIN